MVAGVIAVDAGFQPTLSSDLPLKQQADGGLQQLITNGQILGTIGKTGIPGLHIVVSGDPEGSIKSWILHTPDGEVHMRYFLRDLQLGQRNDHA